MNQTAVYLDHNATTPVIPAVLDAMIPFFGDFFGNPSSTHQPGVKARMAVEHARHQVAELLNCYPDEIIFTSGGTESNNLAIQGTAFSLREKGNHIITSEIEHPAVLEVCRYLAKQGFSITYVPVDEYGMVDPGLIEKFITPRTILITIMHANNETGTIQPVAEIARIARQHGILFHTDAAQSVGKISTDVREMGVDMLSLAGHKFYAPKGIGALFVRRGLDLQKLMHGADHELNRRAGTENVPGIVGLGKAAEISRKEFKEVVSAMRAHRDRLEELLKQNLPDIRINGHPVERLPNTLNVSFPGIEASALLTRLSGLAASAGAACHSEGNEISHVLKAMKVPHDYAIGTIRFSTGRLNTSEEIERAAEMIIEAVRQMTSVNYPLHLSDDFTTETKLTHYARGLGCACKIRPQYLERILHQLPPVKDPNVLVHTSTSDDAAVYLINEQLAIVQTVDVLTPVVDDPYHFGAIATANALSDIYAMGGKPLFALNVVAFPDHLLPEKILRTILQGAYDKASEAGIDIIGGHTLEDNEPKFGMTVTGMVHPARILRNSTPRVGDLLILTKPIGTGIITTALKKGAATPKTVQSAIDTMSMLNAAAASAMENLSVSACTDITGFGLLGHLSEMIKPRALRARIYYHRIPLLPDVLELAIAGFIPGGTKNNYNFISEIVRWKSSLSEVQRLILCDAQTSGGLLMAISPESAGEYIHRLKSASSQESWIIGEILESTADGSCEIIVEE